ncbi:MAG: TAT-variant-translocated molybdopterin oxidoreductase [Candidatus Solibacter usitatus]|nr:TAT-variant-translocated molybdopterin oxidoreductase [Candidatus Solibacter usitatus]
MNDLIQINPSSLTGKKYWRSLDELADTPQFRAWAQREFQEGASEMLAGGSRRNLLKLMAAGFGLAGLTACRRPVENVLPFAKGVESYVPGRPLHYATVISLGGAATGLVVESNEGRPTKVEGNPRHPYSLGATSAHAQASILNLYDPDRARRVSRQNARSSWDEFTAWWKAQSSQLGAGAGLRILSERSSSPAVAAQKAAILEKYPKAQWVEYGSVNSDQPRLGAQMAFGQPLEAHYQYDKAAVVFTLDFDFLGLDSPTVLPTKQFSARRRSEDSNTEINRLYAAESNFTITGAMADHRLRLRSSDVGAFVLALARELNVTGAELKVLDGGVPGPSRRFLSALAKDLLANKGRSLVAAGPRQPAAVHAAVALINQTLGNAGQTVVYTKPVVETTDSVAGVTQLAADIESGAVKTLFLLGGNPVYTLPADLGLARALKKVASTVALAADENETWAAAEWRLPEAHEFESWGDERALDGTASIRQPLIEPLHGGRSVLELAAIIAGSEVIKGHDLVKNAWTAQFGAGAANKKWNLALHDGVIDGTKLAPVDAKADAAKVLAAAQAALPAAAPGIEVVFYPSSGPYDGRFANNAWMQEAPDPMTKLVWDNAALMSPATAKQLGVADGDMVAISANGRDARLPAVTLPGHADNSISLALGYGRSSCGRVGRGVGHRVEGLRTTSGFHIAAARVAKTSETYKLVTTQEHHTLVEPITNAERPGIVIQVTTEEYRKAPGFIHAEQHLPEMVDMFPAWDYSKGYQWGMAIDLNSCVGCNACLVACVAENNIPVVGKDQVSRGREMHWIRMDRYFTGDVNEPQAVVQPMACQQCEKAPCESVCPVAATAHSPEGLNEMAYNRCVGTRYCANNCPYKVRRFNFFNWNKDVPEERKMVFNPDVTVRMRGVMEKCNYCVQRIEEGKSLAKADNRRQVRDGEVLTACQQACPAGAIVFGNINDPESRVAKLKQQPRNYTVIEEVNTKPRTTYLAKLRNSNPELP